MKYTLSITSLLLIAIHLVIFYLWVVDWEKLVTGVGLVSWVGSIIFGLVIYLLFKNVHTAETKMVVIIRIELGTTIMAVFLGVLALVIETITRSMP